MLSTMPPRLLLTLICPFAAPDPDTLRIPLIPLVTWAVPKPTVKAVVLSEFSEMLPPTPFVPEPAAESEPDTSRLPPAGWLPAVKVIEAPCPRLAPLPVAVATILLV